MNAHKNDAARTRANCTAGREWADAEGRQRSRRLCPRTTRKWVERYRCEGLTGLRDRTSRPHRLYRPTAGRQSLARPLAIGAWPGRRTCAD